MFSLILRKKKTQIIKKTKNSRHVYKLFSHCMTISFIIYFIYFQLEENHEKINPGFRTHGILTLILSSMLPGLSKYSGQSGP